MHPSGFSDGLEVKEIYSKVVDKCTMPLCWAVPEEKDHFSGI
jgi:hypothetical protein